MEDGPLVFKPERRKKQVPPDSEAGKTPWKILIADDEPEVHSTTRLVLGDFEFQGRPLEFISAYSGQETRNIMEDQEDIAVILLDVVMESSQAGLDCARHIRETMGNKMVRIVLRTGQPGQAPERQVIVDYDINDYKQKTDLTAQRLFTTVYTALRSYRDMMAIEKNRIGLRYIIEASGDLFKQQSIKKLAKGVLTQIAALFRLRDSLYLRSDGFTVAKGPGEACEIIAATGKYTKKRRSTDCTALGKEMNQQFCRVAKQKKSAYFGNNFVGYFPTQKNKHHILYLEGCGKKENREYGDLLNIFTRNVGVAFDNVYLNQEIQETQQEIIHLLGELVESRSKETAFHVVRVAKYVGIIGRAAGYAPEEVEMIASASPMHDVGKMAIPDAILLKPGRLTSEEFEIMKTHTGIGFKILSASKRKLLKMAATIAHSHHEHWDGSGYPLGLKGEAIPLAGRLTCLADVFDALSSRRIYKDAWSMDEVFNYVRDQKGYFFDPGLVHALFSAKQEILAVCQDYTDSPDPGHDRPEAPDRA